jgi:hypothetical protein
MNSSEVVAKLLIILGSLHLNINHWRLSISIWLIKTFFLRLFFTSDIQAVLLAKREINIDSFEQLIEAKNIIPLIADNSSAHTIIVKVSIDFFELLYTLSRFFLI